MGAEDVDGTSACRRNIDLVKGSVCSLCRISRISPLSPYRPEKLLLSLAACAASRRVVLHCLCSGTDTRRLLRGERNTGRARERT